MGVMDFFQSPQVETKNKGRQGINSLNRKNYSKRLSDKINMVKREQLCQKCHNDKFFNYFYSNKIKCTKCKEITYGK